MTSLSEFVRWLVTGKSGPRTAKRTGASGPPHTASPPAPVTGGKVPTSLEEAQAYIDRVSAKIDRLAEEFASGSINRAQFQELFEHYQHERQTIQRWIETRADVDGWRNAVTEGESIMIRTRHMARVLGYAIYENESGVPITTIGQFDIDPALAVPMLSAYRSATKEIFGGELSSTQIEGGKWLSFIPGRYATLLAVFSTEPAAKQLESLKQLHSLFERANRRLLEAGTTDPNAFVFPHNSFLGQIS